jgi:glucoamylase
VHALIRTQQVVSLSGNVSTGGLEEPVFDIHLDPISNPAIRIGAPAAGAISTQRLFGLECLMAFSDGPPFRAAVLIKYADWLLKPEQHNGTWVADVLWPAINLDLQWIALHWNQSSLVSYHPV